MSPFPFLFHFKNYDTSKGTIRFQADKTLLAALDRKLVKATNCYLRSGPSYAVAASLKRFRAPG